MPFELINPESLGAPRGYSNGVLDTFKWQAIIHRRSGGMGLATTIVSPDFVEQFDRALANLIQVVTEAGGTPEEIARLVLYVTDKNEYCATYREIGERWRQRMGNHYPAMTLVEVKGCLKMARRWRSKGSRYI